MGDDLRDNLIYTAIENDEAEAVTPINMNLFSNAASTLSEEIRNFGNAISVQYLDEPYPHYITIDAQPEPAYEEIAWHNGYARVIRKIQVEDFPELAKLHKKAMEKEQAKRDFDKITEVLEKSILNVETIKF